MPNFIRQNEVNMANEPLKVGKPLLESSSEMDKFQCITNTEHSPDTKITVMGRRFPAQEFQVMESFNRLSLGQQKYLLKKLKNEMHSFTKRSGKIFLRNLYRKSLNICKEACRSAVVLT